MKKQKSNSKMSKPIPTLMMNPSITVVNPKTNLPFEKQKSQSCGFEGTSNVASNCPMKYFSMQWVCAKLSQCTFCFTIFAPSYELNILKKCSLSYGGKVPVLFAAPSTPLVKGSRTPVIKGWHPYIEILQKKFNSCRHRVALNSSLC